MEGLLKISDKDQRSDVFQPLNIQRKGLDAALQNRYHVYKDNGECVTVEAPTAAEALKASGLESAAKIVKDTLYLCALLPENKLMKMEEPVSNTAQDATVAEAPPSAVQTVAAPTPPAATTSSSGQELSEAEVKKLLDGQ